MAKISTRLKAPKSSKSLSETCKNTTSPIITFRVLETAREKRVWMERFRAAYKGGLRPITKRFFTDDHVHIVMTVAGVDVGYMKLRKFDQKNGNIEVYWHGYSSISLTLIKRKYRRRGYQKLMIKHAIESYDAQVIHIAQKRWLENHDYFKSMNLEYAIGYPDGTAYVCTPHLASLLPSLKGNTADISWVKNRPTLVSANSIIAVLNGSTAPILTTDFFKPQHPSAANSNIPRMDKQTA